MIDNKTQSNILVGQEGLPNNPLSYSILKNYEIRSKQGDPRWKAECNVIAYTTTFCSYSSVQGGKTGSADHPSPE